jgi:hypothetical protein
MNIAQIQAMAKDMGLKPGKLRKMELVRAIQRREGAFDCFATAYDGVCDQVNCIWRQDCFKAAQRKHS